MCFEMTKCDYPCNDIRKDFIFPRFDGNHQMISMMMISEAPTMDHSDYFYQKQNGAFFQTTRLVFNDAGCKINSYDDLSDLGVYLTTAIKCPKIGYLVSSKTIKECACRFLGNEILNFPNLKVIMCMGDFAIKAVNSVYKLKYDINPIRTGSTYKIRNEEHCFHGIRFIPSYTQTGNSFNIEQSKRKMIAEDIRLALQIISK
jgi:uracil-DNA glycosylase